MMRTFLIALTLVLLPCAGFAQSPDWKTSFEAEPTVEFVDAQKVIVVSPDEASKPAASVLVEVLRNRELELVMTDEPLGDTSGLSDDQIREKAQNLPVEAILIVRVFPSNAAPTAVLSRSDDQTIQSISVRAGEVMKPSDKPDPQALKKAEAEKTRADTSAKASRLATNLEATAASTTEEIVSLNRGRYQREKITYRDQPWSFHLGAFESELGAEEFYRTIGREDLADTYGSNVGFKTGVLVGSGVAVALGIGLMFVGITPSFDDEEVNWLIAGLGIGSTSVGLGGIIWGATLDTHPISDQRARQLAEDHNSILRKEYGVRE